MKLYKNLMWLLLICIQLQIHAQELPCVADIVISNPLFNLSDQTFTAGNSITGKSSIHSAGNVLFDAGFEITLAPGFDAFNPGGFDAKIGGCNNTSKFTDNKTSVIDNLKIQLVPNPIKSGEDGAFKYYLKTRSMVSISIHDLTGLINQTVFVNREQEKGMQQILIGTDRLTTGIYFIEMTINEESHFYRMMVK